MKMGKYEEIPIHEAKLEELGRRAYELAGNDSRTMYVMLLCMAEMVKQQAVYNATTELDRNWAECLSIELQDQALKMSNVMVQEIRRRFNQDN